MYDVAAEAYEIPIGIMDASPDETPGVKESCAPAEFYDKAWGYLARHDVAYRKHMDNFMALLGPDGQAGIQAFLEQWADDLAQKQIDPFPLGIPYQLRLLTRYSTEAGRQEKVTALQKRFRRIYLALYEPLLAGWEAAKEWQMVIIWTRGVGFAATRQANTAVSTPL